MLPNWPALPGRQDRQNQGEERPCAGGAAPAIDEAAHAAEVAQPTGEAVGGAIPTPITEDPLLVDISLLRILPVRRESYFRVVCKHCETRGRRRRSRPDR